MTAISQIAKQYSLAAIKWVYTNNAKGVFRKK